VDLDPGFAPYHIHHIELAIHAGDSAEAVSRLDAYRTLAPGSERNQRFELIVALFLGDSATQASTLAALDTVSDDVLQRAIYNSVWNSDRPIVVLKLLDEAERRGVPIVFNARLSELATGQFERQWETHHDPADEGWEVWAAFSASRYGGTVDPVTLAEHMTIERCGDPDQPDFHCVMQVGTYHVDRGDAEAASEAIAWMRSGLDPAVDADSTRVDYVRRGRLWADGLEAYASTLTDGPRVAMDRLETLRTTSEGPAQIYYLIWLAELAEQTGKTRDAIRYYTGMKATALRAYANYRLAHLYTELGDDEQATAHWKALLQNWEEADEGLAWEAEAREALEVLLDG
jgi:hypothetical protein